MCERVRVLRASHTFELGSHRHRCGERARCKWGMRYHCGCRSDAASSSSIARFCSRTCQSEFGSRGGLCQLGQPCSSGAYFAHRQSQARIDARLLAIQLCSDRMAKLRSDGLHTGIHREQSRTCCDRDSDDSSFCASSSHEPLSATISIAWLCSSSFWCAWHSLSIWQ